VTVVIVCGSGWSQRRSTSSLGIGRKVAVVRGSTSCGDRAWLLSANEQTLDAAFNNDLKGSNNRWQRRPVYLTDSTRKRAESVDVVVDANVCDFQFKTNLMQEMLIFWTASNITVLGNTWATHCSTFNGTNRRKIVQDSLHFYRAMLPSQDICPWNAGILWKGLHKSSDVFNISLTYSTTNIHECIDACCRAIN